MLTPVFGTLLDKLPSNTGFGQENMFRNTQVFDSKGGGQVLRGLGLDLVTHSSPCALYTRVIWSHARSVMSMHNPQRHVNDGSRADEPSCGSWSCEVLTL